MKNQTENKLMVIATVDGRSFKVEKSPQDIQKIIAYFENKKTFTIKTGSRITAFNPDNVISIEMFT